MIDVAHAAYVVACASVKGATAHAHTVARRRAEKHRFERRDGFPPRGSTQGWVSDLEVRTRVHGRIFLE